MGSGNLSCTGERSNPERRIWKKEPASNSREYSACARLNAEPISSQEHFPVYPQHPHSEFCVPSSDLQFHIPNSAFDYFFSSDATRDLNSADFGESGNKARNSLYKANALSFSFFFS